MAKRLKAVYKIKKVRALKRALARAEQEYKDALKEDKEELERRSEEKRIICALRDRKRRDRIIAMAEKRLQTKRTRKSAWWERVRVHLLFPTIG